MKKKMLGYYDYTVVLTYFGMLSAFWGILHAINQRYSEAVLCLMLAGICDMFDGAVASMKTRTDREKVFGIQIDSLSDLISFGVLPSIFVYMISDKNVFTGLVASIFLLCALIRLSYFNVLEGERQQMTEERRKSYLGIPVTTIALTLPITYLLYNQKFYKSTICFVILLVFMGIGYLSPFEIKKPRIAGKICIMILGILEMLGVFFFMGWDIV